jgi:hypothetical protein
MSQSPVYECIKLTAMGTCDTWQLVDESMPALDQTEQTQLMMAVLGIMVIVWLFKMLKRAI